MKLIGNKSKKCGCRTFFVIIFFGFLQLNLNSFVLKQQAQVITEVRMDFIENNVDIALQLTNILSAISNSQEYGYLKSDLKYLLLKQVEHTLAKIQQG
ncbi:MAG TPA: hypothetical protein ENN78_01405 [Candidatus Omnitrophica bacterium]|nr:hypothetical protein [Candidatus Omnitrophota bacterium]